MADEADNFGGSSDANAAQMSRWNVYHVPNPYEKQLSKIIHERVPEVPFGIRSKIVKLATKINNKKMSGVYFSPRTAIAIAEKVRNRISLKEAIYPCFIAQLPGKGLQDSVMKEIGSIQ